MPDGSPPQILFPQFHWDLHMSYQHANQSAWDQLARANSQFAAVATDAECAQPLLTLDSRGWLPGSVKGLSVLCLAAGGGWQSILYASAGADVTVFDISAEMLKRDAEQAVKRNLDIRVVQGSMDDLSIFEDATFDIVHQPVSTCYVPRIKDVYQEIARVLRHRGLYISQHKQPTSLQLAERDSSDRYVIGIPYYHGDPLPPVKDTAYREPGAVEYLHRWEQLVGDLCRSGLLIEDLVEPRRGDPNAKPGHFRHRGMYVAPYVRIKARRIREHDAEERSPIWVPENP
jgi:ubiquinone/menaquinone biosynthesis C-methylase UbiE